MGKVALPVLLDALSKAREQIKIGDFYYHYRDPQKLYQIISLALDTQNEENASVLVIYQSMQEDKALWSRPLEDFLSTTEVDGKTIKKFTKQRFRKAAGGIVVNKEGRVAVVSQNGNSWSLPKGGVDNNEDLLAAAKREIWEETGLTALTYSKQFKSYRRYAIAKNPSDIDDKELLKEITFFLFKTSEIILNPQDPANPEARWINPEDVSALLTHPKDKDFFESIIQEIKD